MQSEEAQIEKEWVKKHEIQQEMVKQPENL